MFPMEVSLSVCVCMLGMDVSFLRVSFLFLFHVVPTKEIPLNP